MAAIGDFALSLITAEQKVQLALANINFDFTLIKLPPPDEYKDIGKAISPKRKKDAEDGSSHFVARKLAALFTQDADFPKVPHLVKAYGIRASEITQNTACNPHRNRSYGVFAEHVGLDSTSVWAAATSGPGAIAVHLLACMLSTLWTNTQATAIWQEVVLSRKAVLQKRIEGTEFQLSDITAAQIQLTREQLATWDSSARAWCQTANEAHALQQHQLRLIAQGFSKALSSSSDLYATVKRVWYNAMTVLDRLIQGIPQNVQDPEVLLGLLSWHIYPDISVIGNEPKMVLQKDHLVNTGGIITLGMITNRNGASPGISWSLPLSYLRYYGDPVFGQATVEDSASRVSFKEFMFVVLGGLTKTWFDALVDAEITFRFLLALRAFFQRTTANAPRWLHSIGSAAEWFLELDGEARSEALQLVAYGRRKCAFFPVSESTKSVVAFGLKSRKTQFRLLKKSSQEENIAWLREQLPRALPSDYPSEGCIIIYTHVLEEDAELNSKWNMPGPESKHYHSPHPDTRKTRGCLEFATLCPVQGPATEKFHQRWVSANERADSRSAASVPGFYDVHTLSAMRCNQLAQGPEVCSLYLGYPAIELPQFDAEPRTLTQCKLPIEPGKNACFPLQKNSQKWNDVVRELNPSFTAAKAVLLASRAAGHRQGKTNPSIDAAKAVLLASKRVATRKQSGSHPGMTKDSNVDPAVPIQPSEKSRTNLTETSQESNASYGLADRGKTKPACLCNPPLSDDRFEFPTNVNQWGCPHKWYLAKHPSTVPSHTIYNLLQGAGDMHVGFPTRIRPKLYASKLESVIELLESNSFDPYSLNYYLNEVFSKNAITSHEESLDAVATAFAVYKGLPDAKVPISAATKPVYDCKWARPPAAGRMPLTTAFSCIAFFETGAREMNIDPVHLSRVMAISVGDSLYMSHYLSCDPGAPFPEHVICRAVGNVGRPGLAFLVSPTNPRVAQSDESMWRVIKHDIFDGRREDNFGATTLHLSFTGSELPVSAGDLGLYDREAFFLEAVVGAYNGGKWVADLDILSCVNGFWVSPCKLPHMGPKNPCSDQQATPPASLGNLTSIDSWAELLDPPGTHCIVRAHGNWLARLALAAYIVQSKQNLLICAPDTKKGICWNCAEKSVSFTSEKKVILLD